MTKYPTIRCFAPAFLEVFEFRGGAAVSSLLKALGLISEMYHLGKRTLPTKPPTAFIRRAWRSFVFGDGEIDRRAYELCAFFELRSRLRAGDVWVDRSRQYQDFENYLIPKPTFEILKAEGPLPVEVDTDVQRYLENRRSVLTQELATVATLAENGQLPDVDLADGELKITPLRAATPLEAESLRDAAYDLLPRIKITDLLLEVNHWTGFSECFTHQRNGHPAENRAALLTAILADGINLGLSRMAEACRGATLRQLAWMHDWHKARLRYDDLLRATEEARSRAVEVLEELGTIVLDEAIPDSELRGEIFARLPSDDIGRLVDGCRNLRAGNEGSHLGLIDHWYGYTRKYSPALIEKTPFQFPENSQIGRAVAYIKDINRDHNRKLNSDAPIDFLPRRWVKHVVRKDSAGAEFISRQHYEPALLTRMVFCAYAPSTRSNIECQCLRTASLKKIAVREVAEVRPNAVVGSPNAATLI